MTDNYGQTVWHGRVDQAVQDIRLLQDDARNVLRALEDAERDIAGAKYERFRDDVDDDDVINTAGSARYHVGEFHNRIRSSLSDALSEAADMADIFANHLGTLQ